MATTQEKQGSVQERQNQKILDFAMVNFSSKTHEYGREDRKRRENDPSRYNQDLDGDGRKGVDCSSLVYYSMKGAGFNVPNSVSGFTTHSLFDGRRLTNYAKEHFEFVPSNPKTDRNLKPGDLLMWGEGNKQHIAIFKGYDEKGRIHFFGSQTSTGRQKQS